MCLRSKLFLGELFFMGLNATLLKVPVSSLILKYGHKILYCGSMLHLTLKKFRAKPLYVQ